MSQEILSHGEILSAGTNDPRNSKKNTRALRRWRILARALTGSPEPIGSESDEEVSVRRFTSFGLLKCALLENILTEGESSWCEYSTQLDGCPYNVQIRRISKCFTASELIGFNNTGNVCVWPSEECLAYYLMRNRELCRNRNVLELGGGMSCLAGVLAAKYCNPSTVTLTDGNVTSVDNVRCIVARNDMTHLVECGVVQWAQAARALRQTAINGNCVKIFIRCHPPTVITDCRADYWKSQGRKFCDFCKCWIADNKPSIDFHEGGKKHKENVSKRLKEIHKNSAKQAKQNKKFEDDIKKMENAAMAAYLKDVENNTRDMTAERIIKEKLNRVDTKETPQNYNRMPPAAPETVPRFKSNSGQFTPKVDPCDPTTLSKGAPSFPRVQQHGSESRTPGKSKANKVKGKGKKTQEDDRSTVPVRKLWYEARSPEGYTYYWHIETNESVWEPPEEGYMTFAEQEEEVKEELLQRELMEQLAKEEAIEKVNILEEQRANIEREKMKEFRKRPVENDDTHVDDESAEIKKETVEEERPYWRDYSVPERPQPYGSWQVVETIKKKPIDLQLPKQQKQIQLPTFEKIEPPPPQRTFKEKTVTQISTGDSDDERAPTTFKRRKIGNKNVRKRTTDD